MCGIVGFIGQNNQQDTLHQMLKIQAYRGPDDSGIYIDQENGVHFGHNRLSILDLSSQGHQPFISNCQRYVLVYNGEVYNFKEIREELRKLKYIFSSESDTEVILYAYKEWGIACLQKFIGMFAFAILDKTKQTITLARDRAGVKPLYYYTGNGKFIFASEIKSFHKHPGFDKQLNKSVLPYYFQFGYIPSPQSIFLNTYKLEAGHYLEYDLQTSQKSLTKYWDVNDFYQKEPFDKSEEEVLYDLENILDDAIDLRMISDVPVGVFLSGGYDSSLVATILAKKQAKKINTYTIGFNNPKYNEAKHAKRIANYLGTHHTEYYMQNNDMLTMVEDMAFYYDEPFADSSALPSMILSKIAKKKVSVILSSDGGDETFCGYSKYFILNKYSSILSSTFKKNITQTILSSINENKIEIINDLLPKKFKQTNIKDKFQKFKRAISSKNPEEMFINASSYIDKNDLSKILNASENTLLTKFNQIENVPFLNQMMAIDYKTFMCDDVLTKVDRATMSASIEGREPLLDHRLIEYMARVPWQLKYKSNQGKYLMRKILYKYLPNELVDKPKSGFQIPLYEWLRNDLKYLVDEYLDISQLDGDIFNIPEILKIKKELFQGNYLNINLVWFVIVFQLWKKRWFE